MCVEHGGHVLEDDRQEDLALQREREAVQCLSANVAGAILALHVAFICLTG